MIFIPNNNCFSPGFSNTSYGEGPDAIEVAYNGTGHSRVKLRQFVAHSVTVFPKATGKPK